MGAAGEDNTYGKGLIDVYAAYTYLAALSTPLNPFNINSPIAGATVTSFPNSSSSVTATWDTASAGATYKWIFGNGGNPRILVVNSSTNTLNINLDVLDNLLAGLGLFPGDSIVGQWDVWAYRNNPPNFDSLKSANGSRAITLKRGIPSLIPFSLLNPPDNSRIVTSVFNNGAININWRKSGDGVTYKWKFGTNVITNPILNYTSNNSGYDTTLNFVNSGLDVILRGIGLMPGDSIVGQWEVWAYNALDSLKSTETYGLTVKRQAKGDILVAYDSSSTNGRASRDSVINYLSNKNLTFDLFNKGGQSSTSVITFRGYNTILWIGEGTSVMSVVQKDSIKAYLNNPLSGQKSKLAIFSEDIGYQFGRSGSTYLDVNFMNQYLGANYVNDRPTSGANQGLVGAYLNTGLKDSTVGTWPDVLSRFDPPTTHELYKFRSDNTINAIGKIGTTFNVATFGVDIRSLRRAVDSPVGSPVPRFLDAALLYVNTNGTLTNFSLNLTAMIDGFYDGSMMVFDTVTAELRNSSSPFGLMESQKILLNAFGPGTGNFATATEGTLYYLVIKHRNSIETWSAATQSFSSGIMSYNFTDFQNKAYGNNLKQKGTKWCIINGDCNQDNFIDGSDYLEVLNHWETAGTAMAGDTNGDQFIDGSDYLQVVNNWEVGAVLFIMNAEKIKRFNESN